MNEELIKAAKEGNLKTVHELLLNAADPNYKGNDSRATALHRAVLKGHLDVVQILVDSANLETRDKYGRTPLFYAVHGGHLEILKYLLEKGANSKERTKAGTTLLILAAILGHTEIIKFLVENGFSDIQEEKYGVTALFYAAKNGHLDSVKYLVSKGLKGIEIGWSDMEHNVLTIAILKRNEHKKRAKSYKEIIEILACADTLEHTLSYEHTGFTPLFLSLKMGDVEIAELLKSKGANIFHTTDNYETALNAALEYEHIPLDFIIKLIESGVSVKISDRKGQNPLHFIDFYQAEGLTKYSLLVKALLQAGCDAFLKDNWGNTPFHCASNEGNINLLKVFLEHKLQNFEPNREGDTPLLCYLKRLKEEVSSEKCIEMIEFLLQAGDSLSARDKKDVGVLALLVSKNRHQEIDYFSKKGMVDIFERNKRQETLLHIACRGYAGKSVKSSTLQYLLDKGLKPNEVDIEGNTALHYGYGLGELSDLLMLMKSGVKLDQTNSHGETILFALLSHCTGFRLFDVEVSNYNVLMKKEIVNYLFENYTIDLSQKYDNKSILFYIAHLEPKKLYYFIAKGIELDEGAVKKMKEQTHNLIFINRFLDDAHMLWECSKGKSTNAVEFLIRFGDEYSNAVSARETLTGNTALHFALLQSVPNIEFIAELDKRGANFKLVNKYGQTPLDLMRNHKNAYLRMMGYYKTLEQFVKEKRENSKEFQECLLNAQGCLASLKGDLRNKAALLLKNFLKKEHMSIDSLEELNALSINFEMPESHLKLINSIKNQTFTIEDENFKQAKELSLQKLSIKKYADEMLMLKKELSEVKHNKRLKTNDDKTHFERSVDNTDESQIQDTINSSENRKRKMQSN